MKSTMSFTICLFVVLFVLFLSAGCLLSDIIVFRLNVFSFST